MTSNQPEKHPLAALGAEATWRGRTLGHWGLLGLSFALVLGLWIAGRYLTPDARGVGTHEQLGMPPCVTMELWNVPCPGCGVTTSVALASDGRWLDSLWNQPFGFSLWIGAIVFALWSWFAAFLLRKDLLLALRSLNARVWVWSVGSIAVLSWVYKLGLVRGS